MIPYDTSIDPPYIAVDCKLANPWTGTLESVRGKVDTGADMTAIPDFLANRLGLAQIDTVEMRGFDKKNAPPKSYPTYFVNLTLNGFRFEWRRVYACERENILIGRDILNALNLLAYGQDLVFEIQRP